MRIVPATMWRRLANAIATALLVAAALLVGGVLMLIAGADPVVAYQSLVTGALGNVNSVAETLVKSSPLLLAGLGIAFALHGGVFNIGAEGQLYMGALAAAWVGITFGSVPRAVLLPLVILAGFLGGALWGAIPGMLKARFGVSEVINTIMMNYIGILALSYLVNGPFKDANSRLPQTVVLPDGAWLPILVARTRLHGGIILALVAAAAIYLFLWHTPWGYAIRAVGKNPEAARHAGINVFRSIVATMLISGGLAGLAGMGEVAGLQHRLKDGFSPGYGFMAIAVALLGNGHPFGVILAATLFAVLIVGADNMQRSAGVPASMVYIVPGLVVLFGLARGYLVGLLKLPLAGIRPIASEERLDSDVVDL